jgi:hypothetical protein
MTIFIPNKRFWLLVLLVAMLLFVVAAVGPIPSEAIYTAFVVAVFALVKMVDTSVPGIDLPDGFYTVTQPAVVAAYAVLSVFLQWFPADLNIGWMEPALVSSTNLINAILSFFAISGGATLLYRLLRWARIPVLGASKSR